MGLLDKLKGTRPAKAGVEPVPVEDLRTALLGLTRDTAPWHVRDGAEDGCDLVAEWRIVDAQWYATFSEQGLSKAFRVKLKFDEANREVRNLDEQATISWGGGIPSVSKSWSRGQMNEIEMGKAYSFTETGEFGQVYNYKFNSNEIKNPLRDAVTEHGWGWKAVSFKL